MEIISMWVLVLERREDWIQVPGILEFPLVYDRLHQLHLARDRGFTFRLLLDYGTSACIRCNRYLLLKHPLGGLRRFFFIPVRHVSAINASSLRRRLLLLLLGPRKWALRFHTAITRIL